MLGLMLMAMTLPAPLDTGPDDNAFVRCLGSKRARSGEFPAILNCYTSAYGSEDRRLNEVYKVALSRMSTTRRWQTIEQQRQWITDRDTRCTGAAVAEGDIDSQDGRLAELSCLIEETQKRSDLLLRLK